MGDQGDRKTVRAFQCRDYLFEIFDRMSSELECSVDYLINEAMREYARAREQTVAAVDAQELVGSAAAGAPPMSAPPFDARPAPMLTPVPSRRPTAATARDRAASASWPSAVGRGGPPSPGASVQRSRLSRRERRVHHRARRAKRRPRDSRRQHFAEARGGRVSRWRVLHERLGQHEWNRVRGSTCRIQAHRRRRRLSHLRLRASLLVSMSSVRRAQRRLPPPDWARLLLSWGLSRFWRADEALCARRPRSFNTDSASSRRGTTRSTRKARSSRRAALSKRRHTHRRRQRSCSRAADRPRGHGVGRAAARAPHRAGPVVRDAAASHRDARSRACTAPRPRSADERPGLARARGESAVMLRALLIGCCSRRLGLRRPANGADFRLALRISRRGARSGACAGPL